MMGALFEILSSTVRM